MKIRVHRPVWGTPITFLDKYNPNQFMIVWTTDRGGDGKLEHIKKNDWKGLWDSAFVNGSKVYKRIFIKKNAEFEILGNEKDVDGNGTSVNQFEINGKGVYARILIKRL